jgi:Family of unknown function (DUF6152)
MRFSIRAGVFAACLAVSGFAATAAEAHHSAAMFDFSQTVIIKGVLKQVTYMNPHVWISVIGSPDGKGEAEQWDVEATSTLQLARMGIQKDTLKVGDKVAVVMHPLRDGRRAGSFVLVATADGKTYGANLSEANLTAEQVKP